MPTMMPPKTPVSIDGIPMIGFKSIPWSFPQTPRAARNTTYPVVPASAATPSFSVKPMATPIAKRSGRLPKIASPDFAMMSETLSGSHEKFALPTPRRIPATGRTETGNIMHLPIFCRSEKALLKLGMAGYGLMELGSHHFSDEDEVEIPGASSNAPPGLDRYGVLDPVVSLRSTTG